MCQPIDNCEAATPTPSGGGRRRMRGATSAFSASAQPELEFGGRGDAGGVLPRRRGRRRRPPEPKTPVASSSHSPTAASHPLPPSPRFAKIAAAVFLALLVAAASCGAVPAPVSSRIIGATAEALSPCLLFRIPGWRIGGGRAVGTGGAEAVSKLQDGSTSAAAAATARTWIGASPPPVGLSDLPTVVAVDPPAHSLQSSLSSPHVLDEGYDLTLSTEANHGSPELEFRGPYASIRSGLDYSYHGNYTRRRQALQDAIVGSMLNATTVVDVDGNVCDGGRPEQPWIVFTAGAMGAGKTHTIRHLSSQSLFPLRSFVSVDPDDVRRHLPEFHHYVSRVPHRAGELTRKEAGYVSEILTTAALREGRNVIVDGSLRDSEWYAGYFERLMEEYGSKGLRIAILHVTAPRDAVFQRAEARSRVTGRVVPRETLEEALEAVPKSVRILAPLVDFFCELHNAPASPDRTLATLGVEIRTEGVTNATFRAVWEQRCAIEPEGERVRRNNGKEDKVQNAGARGSFVEEDGCNGKSTVEGISNDCMRSRL